MRNSNPIRSILCGAVILAMSAVVVAGTTPEPGIRKVPGRTVHIVGATLVPSPGERIENGQLLIVDGRVAAIGSSVEAPSGTPVIDLEGAWIYPGLVEPFSEYGLDKVGRLFEKPRGGPRTPQYEGTRKGGNTWNDAIHAEREWIDAFEVDAKAAKKLWERGVTTVQSIKRDGIFRGRGFVVSTATGRPAERVLRSQTGHFLSFDKGTSQQSYPSSLMGSIALVRQTFYDADWYAQSSGSADEYNAALASLADKEAPLVFETGDALTLLRAARVGEEFDRPMILLAETDVYERVGAIAALHSPLILHLDYPEAPEVGRIESLPELSLAALRDWERAPTAAAVLAGAGVRFAFTGIDLKKQDLLKNVRKAVEAGLDRSTALAALTTVPAELAGVSGQVGRLAPGLRGDFIVVSKDLFDEKSAIREVWIGGELVHSFEDRAPTDFRGTWEFTIDGTDWTLLLAGDDLTKPKGKLRRGGKQTDLEAIDVERRRLRFRVALKEWDGESGAVRVSIRTYPEGLMGVWLSPDGSEQALSLIKVSEEAELKLPKAEKEDDTEAGTESETEDDEDADADEDAEPEPGIISRLTIPNRVYGFSTPPESEIVLVRGATLWTLDEEGRREATDMLIRDGRISAIGASLPLPKGARVIDASGKHVTPGVIDEHSHIAISRGVNEGSHAVTAEVRIGDVVNPDHIGIYRALAGGVTSAQLLHGSANPIGGQAQVIKLRWGRGAEEMKFRAAPPSIKFALGENVKQSNWGSQNTTRYPQTRMGVETLMRDRFQQAEEYGAARDRWNALSRKDRAQGTAPRRNLQLDALLEILKSERFIHSHSYVQSEILMLMRLAESFGFRVQTFTHILEGYKVASEMAAHGAGGSTFSDWWAYKFEVYDAIPYNTCLMHEAGVVTSINSDSGETIRRLNQEAAKSVMYCGMDEVEALKLATLNSAIQLKVDDRVGSLEVGKDADFVIWSDHPLSIYAHAEQTWIDGALYFDVARDLEMRAADREEKRALIQKVLDAGSKSGKGGKGGGGPGKRGRKPDADYWQCDDVTDVWAKGEE